MTMTVESFVPDVEVAKGEGIRVKCEGWRHAAGKHAINLKTMEGDIALHWNPRLRSREVVRNSLPVGEQWNRKLEERLGGWPLGEEDGAAFFVDFINREEFWEVFVNGEAMPNFNFFHRILKPVVAVDVGDNLIRPQILLLKPLQPLAVSTTPHDVVPPPDTAAAAAACDDDLSTYMEILCEEALLPSPCSLGGGIRVTCDGWDKQQEQMSIRLKSADNDDVQ